MYSELWSSTNLMLELSMKNSFITPGPSVNAYFIWINFVFDEHIKYIQQIQMSGAANTFTYMRFQKRKTVFIPYLQNNRKRQDV